MSPSASTASPMAAAPTEPQTKSQTLVGDNNSKDAITTNAITNAITNANANEGVSFQFPANINITSHPVLFHKITILRSSKTSPGTFRTVLREVTYHLGYEATKTLRVQSDLPVTVPLGKESQSHHEDLRDADCGYRLVDRVAIIPILRSGLGMTDSMLELLPNSSVHHIGMYRTPGEQGGGTPVQYFNRLPRGKCTADVAYVLDPNIGSGGTVHAVVSILKKWGVPKIHVVTVVASKAGLELLTTNHPEVDFTVGVVDPNLTDCGIVLPGMGDVGDRLFGTSNHDFGVEDGFEDHDSAAVSAGGGGSCSADDEAPTTKRKRSASLTLEMDLARGANKK